MGSDLNSTPRRYDRIPISIPVTLVLEAGGKRVGHPSYMVDVSERGMKLKSNVAMTIGEIVEVIPNDGPRYAVRGRVVWVGKAGSDQEGRVGLEFVDSVPTTSWGLATDPTKYN